MMDCIKEIPRVTIKVKVNLRSKEEYPLGDQRVDTFIIQQWMNQFRHCGLFVCVFVFVFVFTYVITPARRGD